MICNRNLVVVVSVMMSVWMLMSCGGHSDNTKQRNGVRVETFDSLVLDRLNISSEDALAYIDSLEQSGLVAPSFICYERGLVYNKMMQKATAELYFQKALEGDDLLNQSPVLFYQAIDRLSSSLANRSDNVEALTVATRGYDISREDQTLEGRRWTAVFLHAMGYCQTQLGMRDEAERNFSMAFMALSQIVAADSCYDNLITYARVSYNILDAYTTSEQYEKAKEWLSSAEEAVERLVASPQCSERDRTLYVGGIAIHKALVLIKSGATASAAQSYELARSVGYFDTSFGIMEQASYLRKSAQWDELASVMPRVDSLARAWDVPLCLAYMTEYMVPQFNAYLKSGNREQAMQMAELMAASIDSVSSYEMNHKMKEIAVIAARKDQNTVAAEQKAEEAYMWVKILSAVLVVLLLCIFGYVGHYVVKTKKH